MSQNKKYDNLFSVDPDTIPESIWDEIDLDPPNKDEYLCEDCGEYYDDCWCEIEDIFDNHTQGKMYTCELCGDYHRGGCYD